MPRVFIASIPKLDAILSLAITLRSCSDSINNPVPHHQAIRNMGGCTPSAWVTSPEHKQDCSLKLGSAVETTSGLPKIYASQFLRLSPERHTPLNNCSEFSLHWQSHAGSPDNGNNRAGDRSPFRPPAYTHKRPSGRRN